MIGGFGPNSRMLPKFYLKLRYVLILVADALLIGIVGHRHPICFLDLDPYANTASNDPVSCHGISMLLCDNNVCDS